jgi:type IV pilus assembly protein PilA
MTRFTFLHHGITLRKPRLFPASDGFTLIELMIVVAIIAIILTLAVPVYSDYSVRAKIAEALSVSNAAKTALSTTCQEDPTIAALTAQKAGYTSSQTKYISSITFSGPCTSAVITVATRQTGAFPDPSLTITGTMKQGNMDFVCVSSGPNKHVPKTCRS